MGSLPRLQDNGVFSSFSTTSHSRDSTPLSPASPVVVNSPTHQYIVTGSTSSAGHHSDDSCHGNNHREELQQFLFPSANPGSPTTTDTESNYHGDDTTTGNSNHHDNDTTGSSCHDNDTTENQPLSPTDKASYPRGKEGEREMTPTSMRRKKLSEMMEWSVEGGLGQIMTQVVQEGRAGADAAASERERGAEDDRERVEEGEREREECEEPGDIEQEEVETRREKEEMETEKEREEEETKGEREEGETEKEREEEETKGEREEGETEKEREEKETKGEREEMENEKEREEKETKGEKEEMETEKEREEKETKGAEKEREEKETKGEKEERETEKERETGRERELVQERGERQTEAEGTAKPSDEIFEKEEMKETPQPEEVVTMVMTLNSSPRPIGRRASARHSITNETSLVVCPVHQTSTSFDQPRWVGGTSQNLSDQFESAMNILESFSAAMDEKFRTGTATPQNGTETKSGMETREHVNSFHAPPMATPEKKKLEKPADLVSPQHRMKLLQEASKRFPFKRAHTFDVSTSHAHQEAKGAGLDLVSRTRKERLMNEALASMRRRYTLRHPSPPHHAQTKPL